MGADWETRVGEGTVAALTPWAGPAEGGKVAQPELLLITDLGLEDVTVKSIRSLAALNGRRDSAVPHRLVVLDHHASSLDRLRAHNLAPSSQDGALSTFDLGDPNIAILIDTARCATRMAYEHRALYATREVDPATAGTLATLVGRHRCRRPLE